MLLAIAFTFLATYVILKFSENIDRALGITTHNGDDQIIWADPGGGGGELCGLVSWNLPT